MTMEGENRPHRYRGGGGGGTGGDLFICFTSRSSSTSMRNPSTKSLPSPGRKDGKPSPAPAALSISRSRRLKNSSSVKGAQSPGLFASAVGGSRKKGGAFEPAEPSSPKVTCIGQVRVKTGRKKKKKAAAVAMRSRSRRVGGGGGGEMSFRWPERGEDVGECFGNRNQRWVHLPLGSICEAVKTFGSEMNCFFPCGGGRSLCSGGGGEREKLCGGDGGGRSGGEEKSVTCGAAFARWLMAIEEGEEKEEVVGVVVEERRGSRREVREVELVADELERGGIAVERKEEEGEESAPPVCVPPRNALLLMRCRSDPVRMSALANRFWGSPVRKVELEEEADDDEHHGDEGGDEKDEKERHVINGNAMVEGGGEEDGRAEASTSDGETNGVVEPQRVELGSEEELACFAAESYSVIDGKGERPLNVEEIEIEVDVEQAKERFFDQLEEKDQILNNGSADGASKVKQEGREEEKTSNSEEREEEQQEVVNTEEEKENIEVQIPDIDHTQVPKCGEKKRSKKLTSIPFEKEDRRWSFSKEREGRRHSFSTEKDYISRRSSSYREGRRSSFSSEGEARRSSFSSETEIRRRRRRRSFSTEKQARRDANLQAKATEVAVKVTAEKTEKTMEIEVERFKDVKKRGEGEKWKNDLPDCLMMMMYEPKLSMEVSKETWVCTADFARPHHQHHPRHQPNKPKPDEALAVEVEKVKSAKEETLTTCADVAPPSQLLPQPSAPSSASPELMKAVEQKLGNATAVAATMTASYGPFVLTRCKSEPMRSSAKLLPDACFWKSRHQPLGAAGLGF